MAEYFASLNDIRWAFEEPVWVTMISHDPNAVITTVMVTRYISPRLPVKPTDVSFTATFMDTGDVLINGQRVHPGMEESIELLCSLADAVSINIPIDPGEYRSAHAHYPRY